MRRLLPYVALSMVYLITPGAGELTENIVHLLTTGHGAHAIDDAEHEPRGDEHGCSGPFHVCQCHTSTGFILGAEDARLGALLSARELAYAAIAERGADGHLEAVFRPPIA